MWNGGVVWLEAVHYLVVARRRRVRKLDQRLAFFSSRQGEKRAGLQIVLGLRLEDGMGWDGMRGGALKKHGLDC